MLVRRNPMMRVPGEHAVRAAHGELVAVRVFESGERALLLGQAPGTFFITPHWQSSPSLLVWLDRVEEGLLRELLIDAWRGRSAKRLVHQWEQHATRERLACRQPES